jgi:DNA-directed RNA polymerase specialized sigma24 family protein
VLRHYEEINIEEIAIMLAISKNSVKTLLRRAVFKLKDFNVSKNQSSSTRDKK